MKTVNSPKHIQRKSDRDLPCVWMLAGVIDYKICDRQYACEECPLDQVLHGSFHDAVPGQPLKHADTAPQNSSRRTGPIERRLERYLSQIVAGSQLYLDRYYTRTNLWLQVREGISHIVGFDMNMMKILHPVNRLVLPQPGSVLRKNQMCGVVIRGDSTIPLHLPLHGRVGEVNTRFGVENGSCLQFEGDPWLFELETDESVRMNDDLYSNEEMLLGYVEKIQTLKSYLRDRISDDSVQSMGVTMADGGEPVMNLEVLLGQLQYSALIRELFEVS